MFSYVLIIPTIEPRCTRAFQFIPPGYHCPNTPTRPPHFTARPHARRRLRASTPPSPINATTTIATATANANAITTTINITITIAIAITKYRHRILKKTNHFYVSGLLRLPSGARASHIPGFPIHGYVEPSVLHPFPN